MSAHLIRLRPYQREAIDAVHAAWEEEIKRPAIVLSTGLGKAQPVDEPVLTPSGWVPIGSLQVGDEVIGSEGLPVKVKGVFPQGVRPTVTMRFSDQTEVRCDTDHLWNVQTRSMKSQAKKSGVPHWKTLTASEVKGTLHKEWYVPVVAPVRFSSAVVLPLDPYTLGVLLGDGGMSVNGQVRVHTRHDVIPLMRLPEGHRATLYRDQGVMGNYLIASGVGRSANLVLNSLRDMGLHGHTAHGKFIPERYLLATPEDRLSLLQGLLDTDGSAAGSGVDYVSVSEQLTNGVAELVRSLGGRCRVSEKATTWTYKGEKKRGTAFRAYITLPRHLSPFRVARKAAALGAKQADPVKRVESVTDGQELECVCISVDAPDHLYVTTGYTLTHNTVIFSHLISEYLEKFPWHRVVVLVHREELCDQALEKLRSVAPDLSIGKVKAGANEVDAQVMVCSTQTLARANRLQQVLPVGLVVADECHHYSSPTFKGVLDGLGVGEKTKFLGVTATLKAAGKQGLRDVIDEVVYSKGLMYGISKGYLVRPEGRLVVADVNLSGVKKSGGDYQSGDLGRALENAGLSDIIPRVYKEHARGHQGVVFTPTVATAGAVAKSLTASGIRAEMVCGATPREERLRIFQDYRCGIVQVLTNAMVLTEGWDMPQASCAVIARPTQSQVLYTQAVGRVLRPFPGKEKALILDLVGASEDNKLCTLVDLEPGLFKESKPCRSCEQTPCVCICEGCGEGKRQCTCPKEDAPELSEAKLYQGKGGVVDLFAGSSHAWLTTAKGVMFIPAGESGEVLLWPEPEGTFTVAHAPKEGKWVKLHTGLPMGSAQAWAESEAEELSPFNAKKTASWRRTKASEGQLSEARRRRLTFSADIKKGDMSNLISVDVASRKIDHYVKR